MALDAFVNAALPAGDPICFGLESGAWAAIGTAVLDAKSALDTAVQQASAGWTGDAATAFASWWQTRSQPMQALGAACDTLAGLLGATAAAVTAADVGWVAAAASVATDAPAIGAAGPESFAGGPAAVAGFIQGCFAPLIAVATAALQLEIVAALEAEALVCQAAATGVVVAVETTIASTAAAAVTVAGLAAGLATALVVDPGKLVPQATTGQTLVSVGIPVATGTLAVGLKAGSTVAAYREAAAAARAAGSTSSDTGMMQTVSPAQMQDIIGQTRIGQAARRVAPAVDALKGASDHAGTAADVASLAWAGGHLAASKAEAPPEPSAAHAVDTAPAPPPGRHVATPPQAHPEAARATDATAQRPGVSEPAPPQANLSGQVSDTTAQRPGVDEPAPPQPHIDGAGVGDAVAPAAELREQPPPQPRI